MNHVSTPPDLEGQADHRTTTIGRIAKTKAHARYLMTRPWSGFCTLGRTTDPLINLFCLHLEAMDSAYREWFGAHLVGRSPLQVTMYSGPPILRHQKPGAFDDEDTVGPRTWIEWSGGSLSAWNAAPSEYAIQTGCYDKRVTSRIWRPGTLPEGTQEKIAEHPQVTMSRFWINIA